MKNGILTINAGCDFIFVFIGGKNNYFTILLLILNYI